MDATEKKLWRKFAANAGFWIGLALVAQVLTMTFLEDRLEYLVPGILLIGAGQIFFFDKLPLPGPGAQMLKRAVALFMAVAAVWLVRPLAPEERMPWQTYSDELVAAAKRGGRPVLIDFTADWCPPCHELERKVFSKRKVVTAAERFLVLKADLTDRDSPPAQELGARYQVNVLPTVIFLGGDGSERTALRLLGYESAERFLKRLAAVK